MQQGDNVDYEEKPIDNEIFKMIQDANNLVKIDLKDHFNLDIKNIEPQHLDLILPFYKKGTFWNKKKRESVILILGSTLGQIMVDKLGFEWVDYKDKLGEEIAIRHLESNWRAFPFSSVRKRIKTRESGYFVGIYKSFETEIVKSKDNKNGL